MQHIVEAEQTPLGKVAEVPILRRVEPITLEQKLKPVEGKLKRPAPSHDEDSEDEGSDSGDDSNHDAYEPISKRRKLDGPDAEDRKWMEQWRKVGRKLMQSYCELKLDSLFLKSRADEPCGVLLVIQGIKRIDAFMKMVTKFIQDAEKFFETFAQAQEAGIIKDIMVHWVAWDSHTFCGNLRQALMKIGDGVMDRLKERAYDDVTSMNYNSMRMPDYVKALKLSTTFPETVLSLIDKLRPLRCKSPFCVL